MIRRDEVIERLGNFNSTDVLNREIESLEKVIDNELLKEENIKLWINDSDIGSSTLGNLELVNKPNITNDVHRNINVVGDDKITIQKTGSSIAYTLWSDNLTLNGENVSEEPWEDRTIAEGEFNGVLTIKCPEETNKNVAYLLAQRYMAIDKKDENGNIVGGYWSKAVKPNNEDNENDTGTELTDAVTVTYDKSTDTVYMNFKLF